MPLFYHFGKKKNVFRWMRSNLLISVAVTVMLCQGDDSRSRGFKVKIEPFSALILKIRSISVCRSTEYLAKKRLVNPGFRLRSFVYLLFLKVIGSSHDFVTKTWPVKCGELFWICLMYLSFRQFDIFGCLHYSSSMIMCTLKSLFILMNPCGSFQVSFSLSFDLLVLSETYAMLETY